MASGSWKCRRTISSKLCVLGAAFILASPGCVPPSPAGCATNADCDDAVYCNGAEVCDPNNAAADAEGCVVGAAPCTNPTPVCDEDNSACAACQIDANCDQGEFCDVQTGECVVNEDLFNTTAFDTDYDRVHGLHQAAASVACADCHHTEPVSAGFASCHDCHSPDPNGTNSFKDAAHDANESNDGCRKCHAAEFGDNCAFCHTALKGQ